MKFFIFVIAIVALLWLLKRSLQRAIGPAADVPSNVKPEPQAMLACGFCGLHLPRDEALPGRGGVFCSEGHRRAFEQAHPPS